MSVNRQLIQFFLILALNGIFCSALYALECKVKEPTGIGAPMAVDSDQVLGEILSRLQAYRLLTIYKCDIGESPLEYGGLRVRFFSNDVNAVVDSMHSTLSRLTVSMKTKEVYDGEVEIVIYVRSESEERYHRLLHAVIDGRQPSPVLTIRYHHEKYRNQKRFVLISMRAVISKSMETNDAAEHKLLFFSYEDRGIAVD